MSLPTKQINKYNENKDYIIFAIIHPITKDFYIHFSSAIDIENVYKQHYNLYNLCTKNMFKMYRYSLYPPEMYTLNKLTTTPSICYTHQIAWIKYFIKEGYQCLNISDDIEASENLFEDTKRIYEKICDKNIEEVINSKSQLIKNYGRKHVQHEPNEVVICNFKITAEERELIKNNAKKHDKTLGAYLTELGLTGNVFEINYNAIREHTDQISLIKNQINSIIKLLVDTGQATPQEINKIIELLSEIRDSENKLLKMVQKEQITRMNKIKKILNE